MSDRLLALAGPGRGPLLTTRNLRRPTVSIRGLVEGTLTVLTDKIPLMFYENGTFEVNESLWMRVEAEGNCKNLICMIQGDI